MNKPFYVPGFALLPTFLLDTGEVAWMRPFWWQVHLWPGGRFDLIPLAEKSDE